MWIYSEHLTNLQTSFWTVWVKPQHHTLTIKRKWKLHNKKGGIEPLTFILWGKIINSFYHPINTYWQKAPSKTKNYNGNNKAPLDLKQPVMLLDNTEE